MNFQDLKIIVSQIRKKIVCPKCSSRFMDEDIDFIGQLGEEQCFFYAFCEHCEIEVVVNVTLQYDSELNLLPEALILPNLGNVQNVQKVRKLGAAPRLGKISMNEVLDLHNFLKDFNGDFTNMFKS